MSDTPVTDRWSCAGARALVTGGTRGIGRAIVHELESLGARVVAVSRTLATGQANHVTGDIANARDRERIINESVQRLGGLDILVNNAGFNIRKLPQDYTTDEIRSIFETNMFAPLELCRLAHPQFQRAGGGVIVNISSVAGLTHMSSGAPYAMAKAALNQLTRNLATDWAADNIRVNAIAPWYINTPLVAPVFEDKEKFDSIIKRTPLRRVGEPEEVAALAAFLCLPAAGYITGQTIAVDGGYSACGWQYPVD